MKITRIFSGLLVLLILAVIVPAMLAGCNDAKAKDLAKLAVLAGEYKFAAEDNKPARLDALKAEAINFAKTYGKADAESLVVKLRDSGKMKPDVANWLLDKIKGIDSAPSDTSVPSVSSAVSVAPK